MRKLLLMAMAAALPLAVLLMSCGGAKEEGEAKTGETGEEMAGPKLVGFDWMLGTWKMTGDEMDDLEAWQQDGDSKFSGRGFRVKDGDTMITEILTLVATDSGTYYIAEVGHNLEPTYFKMTSHDSLMATFENPMHDFPQKIVYTKPTPDSLLASAEGVQDGKMRTLNFNFELVTK